LILPPERGAHFGQGEQPQIIGPFQTLGLDQLSSKWSQNRADASEQKHDQELGHLARPCQGTAPTQEEAHRHAAPPPPPGGSTDYLTHRPVRLHGRLAKLNVDSAPVGVGHVCRQNPEEMIRLI
jgi:hypothetical protein